MSMRCRRALIAVCIVLTAASACGDETAGGVDRVDYNRQVRHILSRNCYACHGPDSAARKVNLRLDTRAGALAPRPGGPAIVPGEADESKLVMRVLSFDESYKMPPPESGKQLTDEEIDLLTRWIDQGAKYADHWAFVPPTRPDPPTLRESSWPRNAIDSFILARLERDGIKHADPAPAATLARRAALDLTGLPLTPAEIEAFTGDTSPQAYEKLVDRLLASPRYGERMAVDWLDAARYADTNGYHIDNGREMWPWRDWVIGAFNANMPFDEFTIEQLAGDLLPGATRDQKIATGFNRNHMINFEGGAIPEEYLNEYVIDRTVTTGTVWMGLTIGCARCHEHKFDPISQKEFYEFYAFFDNVAEIGLDGQKGNAAPFIRAPRREQAGQLDQLQSEIERLTAKLDAPMPAVDVKQARWQAQTSARLAGRWNVVTPIEMKSTGGATLTPLEDGSILASGENPETDSYELRLRTDQIGITGIRLEALMDESLTESGPGRAPNGNVVLTEFEVSAAPVAAPDDVQRVELSAAHADYSQPKFPIRGAIDGDANTGWATGSHIERQEHVAVFVPERPIGFASGTELRIRIRHDSQFAQHALGRFRIALTTDPDVFREMSPVRLGDWWTIGPFQAKSGKEAFETAFEPEQSVELSVALQGGAYRWARRVDFTDGELHTLSGENSATYLYRTIFAPTARRVTLSLGSDDAIKVWLNQRIVHQNDVARGAAPDQDFVTLNLEAGENRLLMKIVNFGGMYAFYFDKREEQSGDPPLDVARILSIPSEDRSEAELAHLRGFYRARHSPEWKALSEQLASLNKHKAELLAKVPTTMVMAERDEPRMAHLLKRGQYNEPADVVHPGVPAFLPPLPVTETPNRLTLARWLVDPSHPLTARVTVNRLWQMVFGIGLVKTAEDFGTQGDPPSNPDLLDWLAVEFIESGWDVKHMMRLMVTSATYRQSSRVSPELCAHDPKNRLLGRGPRFRLPAEMIRDNALAISGLLVERIGGPSVKPYQPPNLWRDVSYEPAEKTYTQQVYRQSAGDDLYRRTMYSFWKRSSPPPRLTTFDAPSRETCRVRRARTNTPLQALTLLNDPTYIEASRALAQRMHREGGASADERIAFAFRLATARPPGQKELHTLHALYDSERQEYEQHHAEAHELLAVGDSERDKALPVEDLAAWTTVASVILNLDETITKN